MRATQVLTGLMVTLVMFGLIELASWLVFRAGVAVRTTRPPVEYPFHPYLGWENHRNFTDAGVLARGLSRWTIRTDSLGESATPLFADRDPDVIVAVVGGSAMYGIGQTENVHTVPSQIERELHQRTGLRVEVHNLAVCGYTSFQEMLSLERYLSNHRADVVVSVSGFNDAVAAALEDGTEYGLLLHRRDPKVELIRSIERGDLDAVPVTAHLVFAALRRRSCAIDLLGKVSDHLLPAVAPPWPWSATPVPDSTEVARRARFVLSNYAMMDAMARQNGARYFMFLQPAAMTRRALTRHEHQAIDSLDRVLLQRVQPVMRVFYSTVRTAERKFPFADITNCFDEFPGDAYGDDCHYLDAATPVVAGAICDVIERAVIEAARRHGAEATSAVSARAARR